jgi:DNA-binding PadR family transcriptional regulator
MSGDRVRGHLDLLVLSVLEREELHGYAVVRALREQSGGVFDLPEGTVYPSLHRLERDGLLESSWREAGGRRRRVYRATPAGRRAVASERREWDRFSTGVLSVIGGRV